MPILSSIDRRAPATRLLIGTMYVLLLAGAVTMIYPFLLMVAGSTQSAVDSADARLAPAFLLHDADLYRKYTEGLFNEQLSMMQSTYGSDALSFRTLDPPATLNGGLVEDWKTFLETSRLPPYYYALGFVYAPVSRGVFPHLLRDFKRALSARFNGQLDEMNLALGTEFAGWNAVYLFPDNFLVRHRRPSDDALARALDEYKGGRPLADRYYFSPEGFYKNEFLKSRYTRDLAAYNRAHGTACPSWDEVHLEAGRPAGPGRTEAEGADWELFVRSVLNLLWIRAEPEAAPVFRDYLRARYGEVAALNTRYGSNFASFDQIELPDQAPADGVRRSDWETFLQGWTDPHTGELYALPADHIRIYSVDFLFRDFLKQKYSTIAALNQARGTHFPDWMQIVPPQAAFHFADFKSRTGWFRRELATRNFVSVLDYLVWHGRGLGNTAVYCLLAVLAALVVNPLAAYALSRYRPPSTYKVLLFLMLTMSFPPMVTQIPVFLMLREFSLLNTFGALVLPGLANGYAIFLLKGFFDSLPRDLYESAELDGAGEFRIFWQITMSLSTPILAVIALNAFTHAYTNFMFALLICQDERMWTIMPWLYQLQMRSGPGILFASLLLASVPTFFVFVFCQNVILRGIVLPVEK